MMIRLMRYVPPRKQYKPSKGFLRFIDKQR